MNRIDHIRRWKLCPESTVTWFFNLSYCRPRHWRPKNLWPNTRFWTFLGNAEKTVNQAENVLFWRKKSQPPVAHPSTKRGEFAMLQPSTSSNTNRRNLIRTRPIQWQNHARMERKHIVRKPRLRPRTDKLCCKICSKYCPYKNPFEVFCACFRKDFVF